MFQILPANTETTNLSTSETSQAPQPAHRQGTRCFRRERALPDVPVTPSTMSQCLWSPLWHYRPSQTSHSSYDEVVWSREETKPGLLSRPHGDGRFCFGYNEAEIVLKISALPPNRLPLRTLHCLCFALFNLFVSAKYLALNCNSPWITTINSYCKEDGLTFKGVHQGFH